MFRIISPTGEQQIPVLTWKQHLDAVTKNESFGDTEKKEILDGIQKVIEVFGEDWPQQAAKTGHPLLHYLQIDDWWTQLWLADLGRRLGFLEGIPKFNDLLKRLKNSDQYIGAEPELDTASRIKAAGFAIELYPKVKKGEADIKTTVDGDELYLEVTSLEESRTWRRAWNTFDQLGFPYVFDREVEIHSRIHKILAKPRVSEFRAKMERAIAKVKVTKEYEYVGEKQVFDCLVLHRGNRGQLDTLLNTYRMEKGRIGPPLPEDDMRRLESKFWDEIVQIPRNKPSVIVVYCQSSQFYKGDDFFDELVYGIEDTIYEHNNLVFGIVVNRLDAKGKNICLRKPNYTLVRKSRHGWLSEDVIIIENRYSSFTHSQKLIAAFTDN